MAWIESNQEIARHPKTRKLSRLLDQSVVSVIGHLHMLWWWALDYAQDGNIGKYDGFDIAEACMWRGDHQSFVDALIQAGFVDKTESGLYIHDWLDYAGRLMAQKELKKEKSNERVKRHRANKAKSCNAAVMLCNAPTVPNHTVPDLTEQDHTVDDLDLTVPNPKKTFGEKVHLSEQEHEKLVKKNGEEDTNQMIEILDNWYLTKGGKPNKSDYHTMVGGGWVLTRLNEDKQRQRASQAKRLNRPRSFDAIDEWAAMTEGMEE